MPGMPPLEPPPADCEPPPELLDEPPEEPPLEPDDPPEEPDDPPLELGLEGMEEEEDCCCWAHPPISMADTELMAIQWMAMVSNRLPVGDDAPDAGSRVV
jgi:hypothetical protein